MHAEIVIYRAKWFYKGEESWDVYHIVTYTQGEIWSITDVHELASAVEWCWGIRRVFHENVTIKWIGEYNG